MKIFIFWIGNLASLCTTGAFYFQLLKIIKTKETKDISLWMYIVITIGVVCWLIYGILLKEIPIIIANVLTLIGVVTILVLMV